MYYLIAVSLVWAFSFSIIKTSLSGLDPVIVSMARMFLSLVVFLPFLRPRGIPQKTKALLMLNGLLQYGLMYIFYIWSFKYLKAYEVALFTIFTPILVSFFSDVLEKKFHPIYFLSCLLCVLGTGIISYKTLGSGGLLQGFLLVQASNACFALGQLFYVRLKKRLPGKTDKEIYGLLYSGAFALTLAASLMRSDIRNIALNGSQIISLLYLGIIASGLCFFFWNRGACLVNAGTLGILNNLKVPLAVAVALIFFGERTEITNLFLGGIVIFSALIFNEKYTLRPRKNVQ